MSNLEFSMTIYQGQKLPFYNNKQIKINVKIIYFAIFFKKK